MKNFFILASLALLFSGCSSYRESLGEYHLPTTNIKESTKEGRVCYYTGGLKFWGSNIDFTIDTARRNGKITNINAIEKETSGNILLRRKCLIVRGN
jgi:PBP1b-binding outer membrane lipoprotein LpoB